MSAKFYKLIYDISVFYTLGAFLSKCIWDISIDGRLFLILLITIGITTLFVKNRKLSIPIAILLPIASLPILTPAIPDFILLLVVLSYYLLVSITGRVVTTRGAFTDILKHTAALFLLLMLLMLAIYHNFAAILLAACPYFTITLVSAVFLLRYLRIDNQMDQIKSYHRQQLLELLSFLVISLLLTLIKAPQNLLNGLQIIYLYVLAPILTLLAWIFSTLLSGIIYVFVALYNFLANNKKDDVIASNPVKIVLGKPMDQYINSNGSTIPWLLPVIYSIGAIIGTIILFYFIRRLMGGKLNSSIPSGISETREYLEDAKDKRSIFKGNRAKDARESIRFYYGKSISWLQHRKVTLETHDTTEDINMKYHSLLSDETNAKESSTRLMQLYRKARYQMNEPISKEDVEKAKQLYQSIVKPHSKS